VKAWLVRLAGELPGSRWLPDRVARTRASIHTKLLVAFLGIVVLLVALGGVGLSALQNADERAADLVRLERRIAAYRQLQHNATGQLYAVASAFVAADERTLDAALRRLQRFAYDFDRAEFVARDREDVELLRGIETEYAELIRNGTQIIELVRSGKIDEARALHHERSMPLANRLERHTYTLVNKAEADMVERAELSSAAYRTSQIVMIAVSLGAILLALVLGYSISASLVEPVREIRARLRNIAGGEFGGQLEVANHDELGQLAENVNRMSRKLHRLYGELEAANRHKSAFLANMSHELRTPMNAIIGFNRLVMRRCKDILPQKQYENLGKIALSADHLLMLINTVLDLSKIEAGRMEVHPSEFDLGPLLDGCARTAEPLLNGKQVKLVKYVGPALPTMCTDQDNMRQILLNLLSNAAKFTDHGRIVMKAWSENGTVSVSVSDTGIGIPAEYLPRIFEEFTQVDGGTTRRHAGTGLGLAISQRLANLIGGGIAVESNPGAGSTFTVTVPVRYQGPRVTENEPVDEGVPTEERVSS
jgi:signal transduction histidine kinase